MKCGDSFVLIARKRRDQHSASFFHSSPGRARTRGAQAISCPVRLDPVGVMVPRSQAYRASSAGRRNSPPGIGQSRERGTMPSKAASSGIGKVRGCSRGHKWSAARRVSRGTSTIMVNRFEPLTGRPGAPRFCRAAGRTLPNSRARSSRATAGCVLQGARTSRTIVHPSDVGSRREATAPREVRRSCPAVELSRDIDRREVVLIHARRITE